MSLRAKVATELGVLAGLTLAFLLALPRRSSVVDFGLAAFALVCIGLSARYTKNVIWATTPSHAGPDRSKHCWALIIVLTTTTAVLFLLIGAFVEWRTRGWTGVSARILNPRILMVFAVYLPWALAQQTLFQFYLLGRLFALVPVTRPFLPAAACGIAYSLVHLPDVTTAAVTAVAGVVWSLVYFKYRMLLPLAFSHAVLGSTFYCWVCGELN
jgi:hypothetical protein